MADFPEQAMLGFRHGHQQKCQNSANQQQWNDLRVATTGPETYCTETFGTKSRSSVKLKKMA